MTPPARLPGFVTEYQARVIHALDARLPPADREPAPVHASMRYTALADSKRVRAALALLAADLCGGEDRAMAVAVAVELVHASSLILDDLPSMDDAPLRRGRQTNHLVFGEAVAILAAFGLLNLAFDSVAEAYPGELGQQIVRLLAEAIGSDGLIAGQAEDLLATDREITFETLERIHRRKTGALFSAAATAGALIAGGTREQIGAVAAYAKNLGLAFQIIDDLLDVEGDPARTGKAQRLDAKKTTFVSFSGAEGARQLAGELCATANATLERFGGRADRLRQLSAFVAGRTR
jgi:geranylgeranyl diphosphate synthase, type II